MTEMLTASCEHGFFDSPVAAIARPAPAVARRRAGVDLLPTVDATVIPRLHAALQNDLQRPRHPLITDMAKLSDEIGDLAARMLSGDVEASCARIDAMRRAGRSLETIYLTVLAPAACHLRDLWSDDLCTFADVTLALCNLQAVLRRYAPDFYAESLRPDRGSRVLIVAPPGDGVDALAPMFGLMLMSQFFRRDGWDASIERDLAGAAFDTTIREWFDLVEVLAAADTQLDAIASGIRAIRRGSPNRAIGVVVCGRIFAERPDYVARVGADRGAVDPLSSLVQANAFLTQADRSRAVSQITGQPRLRRLS